MSGKRDAGASGVLCGRTLLLFLFFLGENKKAARSEPDGIGLVKGWLENYFQFRKALADGGGVGGVVHQFACEVAVVGCHVEVTVAAEVEKDGF